MIVNLFDEPEPGDAAEPYRCKPDDFPFVTYTMDVERWPHVVAVAGGLQYLELDARWVYTQFLNILGRTNERNAVQVQVAPTAGACSLLFARRQAERLPVSMSWLRPSYGRAAEFRSAWELLAHADSVILFEPFDAIARHVVWLAPKMETRWGRGIPVKRIPAQR